VISVDDIGFCTCSLLEQETVNYGHFHLSVYSCHVTVVNYSLWWIRFEYAPWLL